MVTEVRRKYPLTVRNLETDEFLFIGSHQKCSLYPGTNVLIVNLMQTTEIRKKREEGTGQQKAMQLIV